MDNIIKKYYRDYGYYSCEFRSLHHIYDGLKPVERRILLSAFEIAKEKFVKSRKVNAYTSGSYHPHGDVYGSLSILVKNGFLDGQGEFGCDFGIESTQPAADRYTECKLSKFIEQTVFRFIKHVPWLNLEWEVEPLFLPTLFPFCLMGKRYSVGIAFGYRSLVPCYKIEDLYNRLLFLLGKIKKEPIIKPISDCEIISSVEDLKNLLITGAGKISVKGRIKYNEEKHEAFLFSWPYGRKFQTLLKKFNTELTNRDIAYNDLSSDENGGTLIHFEVIKQRNKEEIFKKFKEKMENSLIGDVSFSCIFIDEDRKPKQISIDNILLKSYELYKKTCGIYLDYELKKIENLVDEFNHLKKIRPELSKYLKTGIKIDLNIIIPEISTKTKISEEIIKSIFQKYNIRKLFTVDLDLEEKEKEIEKIKNNKKNLEEYTINIYDSFLKNKDIINA